MVRRCRTGLKPIRYIFWSYVEQTGKIGISGSFVRCEKCLNIRMIYGADDCVAIAGGFAVRRVVYMVTDEEPVSGCISRIERAIGGKGGKM